jgi:hypothetical protein
MKRQKQQKREGSKISLPVLIFSFVLLAMVTTMFFYYFVKYEEVREVDMRVRVGTYVGFNLDSRYLEFGTVMPGGSSDRHMEIQNTYDKPLFVEIDFVPKRDLDFLLGKTKPIEKEWIIVSENNFILEETQSKSIKFTVKPSGGTPYGNYTCKAIIKFHHI